MTNVQRTAIRQMSTEKRAFMGMWLAAKWFQRAAEQGNAEAQYELGELYNDGFNLVGGTVNENEAVKWYRKAAEHGPNGAPAGSATRTGW